MGRAALPRALRRSPGLQSLRPLPTLRAAAAGNPGLDARPDPRPRLGRRRARSSGGRGRTRPWVSPSWQGRIKEARPEPCVNVGGWVLSACITVCAPGTVLVSLREGVGMCESM